MVWFGNRALAPTATLIEGWESGLSAYSGPTADWSVQSTTVYEGSNALESLADFNKIYDADHAEAPSPGDEWDIFVRSDAGDADTANLHIVEPMFGVQDGSNYYSIRIQFNNGNVNLYEWVSGSNTSIGFFDASPTFVANEWYRIHVTWDDGTLGGVNGDITVEIFDNTDTSVGSLTANNTTYTSGGIGVTSDIDTAGGYTVFVDTWQRTTSGASDYIGVSNMPNGAATADDWTLAVEDHFDTGSLDSNLWGIGFGWGTTANNDAADVDAARVSVSGTELSLEVESTGDGSTVTQGAINSKDAAQSWNPTGSGITFSPPVWIEAREKPINREGILPAFWSKPNNEDWPPEIDFLEIFHNGDATDPEIAHFNTHTAASGNCNDSTNVQTTPNQYDYNNDLSQTYHIYGCHWEEDQVSFYFDGNLIATESGATMASALSNDNCNPFYMMFTNHVNRVGTADLNSAWTETHKVDWVRVWDPSATIIEDFESYADTAAFRAAYNTNDAPNDFAIETTGNALVNGSQCIVGDPPGGGGDNAWTLPSDGVLNYYPGRGDVIELYFTPLGTDTPGEKNGNYFWFGIQDSDVGDRYSVRFDVELEDIFIREVTNGVTQTETVGSEVLFEYGKAHRVVIDFDSQNNGDITVTVYDPDDGTTVLGTETLNDTTWGGTSTGIGFQGDWEGGSDQHAGWDYLRKIN